MQTTLASHNNKDRKNSRTLSMIRIFFLLTLLLTGCEKALAMKIEKPSYYVKFNMSNCPRIIAINGFTIEEDLSGYSNYSEYPINHLIKNGSNTLELLVGDQEVMEENTDQSTVCQAVVRVRGLYNGNKVDYKVTDIVYTPKYTGDESDLYKESFNAGKYTFQENDQTVEVEKNEDFATSQIHLGPLYFDGVGASFGRQFTANVPFSEWDFFQGEEFVPFPMTEETFEDMETLLKPVITNLWDLFENKDINKILPLFEQRSREIDQAFYKSSGTTQSELKDSLENVFKRDLPLHEIDDESLQFVASFNGKLAALVDAEDNSGSVLFYDEKSESYTGYTIYWMKKDGKWIIAR